jgi:3-hydroxyisobutyrate dehydrogenase-like beta-hydroxyacid dehydrogenase
MTVCWLVVNTLLGVGMQVVAEAVALGSPMDLPRDLLFDTLAKTAVVAPAHIGKLAGLRAIQAAPNDTTACLRVRTRTRPYAQHPSRSQAG